MPELLLFAIKIAVICLLWLFVISAVVVVRGDVFGRRTAQARTATSTAASPARRPPRSERRSQAKKLVVTEGKLAGTSMTLGTDPVTIGRADDSTLVLTDDYISSRHARLVPGQNAWLVEDLGSTNGTFLDRQKVSRPTPVPIGSRIRVGKTVLELRK
jgi:pSer/pThr/pTyr-binding forkhead associated (FHA) protein